MMKAWTRILALTVTMTTMPASAQDPTHTFDAFFTAYDSFAVKEIRSRRFTQSDLRSWLKPFVDASVVSARDVGVSAEGRPLTVYRFGTGAVQVLLWSQMHGDEPTATMAIVDILSFFQKYHDDPRTRSLREQLTISFLPMVNPDGAERFTRRTSQNIDMNRDALRLTTPEARTLKRVRDELKPAFGFNLHDQDPRYTVGTTGSMTAIALLAPAFNAERADNGIRTDAKRLAALIAQTLGTRIPGRVAKWDDTFEPRAFGDNVQRWGTSTILIESGGWKNDPDKMYLRKLNAVALLTSFVAIAEKTYLQSDIRTYESLPYNMRLGFDVLLTRCTLRSSAPGAADTVDIGLNRKERVDERTGSIVTSWVVEDIGDLHTFTAHEVVDRAGAPIDPALVILENELSGEELKSLIPLK